MDWDDLRIFGAVVLKGGLATGARAAGMSQATARRRLRALEQSCGFPLLRRTIGGLAPTPAGEKLVGPIKAMVARTIAGSTYAKDSDAMTGAVRIEIDSRLSISLLLPLIGNWGEAYPRLRVDLVVSDTPRFAPDAVTDIVVRTGSLAGAPANARIVARLAKGLFAHRRYLEPVGPPASSEDLNRLSLIGCESDTQNQRGLDAFGASVKPRDVAFKINSLHGRQRALRAGLGVGRDYVELLRADPNMVRVLPEFESEVPVWTALVDGDAAGERARRLRASVDRHFEDLGERPRPRGRNALGEGL